MRCFKTSIISSKNVHIMATTNCRQIGKNPPVKKPTGKTGKNGKIANYTIFVDELKEYLLAEKHLQSTSRNDEGFHQRGIWRQHLKNIRKKQRATSEAFETGFSGSWEKTSGEKCRCNGKGLLAEARTPLCRIPISGTLISGCRANF